MPEAIQPPKSERLDRIQTPLDKEYFKLQFDFARAVSDKTGIPFEKALFSYTSLPGIFGCGLRGDDSHPAWQEYLDERRNDQSTDPLTATYNYYRRIFIENKPISDSPYGCFSFEPPNDDGILRIHFSNAADAQESPLSDEGLKNRRDELQRMFQHIHDTYGAQKDGKAIHVKGGSWLYSLESYRSLFPSTYAKDPSQLVKLTPNHGFRGFQRWGQFIDKDRKTRPDAAQKLFENLKKVDANHIGDAFPLPSYRAEAPIQDFYDFYGIK
jgi:hypothetical protein